MGEPAATSAYHAAIAQILQSRYQLGDGRWAQTVNDFQYHAFWLRDAAVMVNALDLAGLPQPAAQDLDFYSSWQLPSGLFISRPGQYDGIGQALWALGRHAELTGDAGFAQAKLQSVTAAVNWIANQLASDPSGLLPASNPNDDEFISGRLAGDDFWAVAGMDAAVALARVAGASDLAAQWTNIADRLRASVAHATRTAAARNGGAVPPALDHRSGRDWGNWWVAYPDGPLPASDPIVAATVARARAAFRQGIATYNHGRWLHDYLGFRILETELERGNQSAVVAGLYSELAHSTGTYGGFETGIQPNGPRSNAENLTPHATYSGELVTLVRNMLVRDDGHQVILLGAVPPAWLAPGKLVRALGAPTTLGPVSLTLRSQTGGATLSWSAPAGVALRWPLPYGVIGFSASAGSLHAGTLELPGATGTITVHWRLRAGAPTLAGTVAALRRRYGV